MKSIINELWHGNIIPQQDVGTISKIGNFIRFAHCGRPVGARMPEGFIGEKD